MNRRNFIAGVAGLATVAGGGGYVSYTSLPSTSDEQQATKQTPTEEVPEAVKRLQPLAGEFRSRVAPYFDDVHVYITQAPDLVMKYASSAETASELKTEFHQIAVEYATVVKNGHEPTTLSIVNGGVQAIVPVSSLRAHVNGDIDQNAFLETIEVMGVE